MSSSRGKKKKYAAARRVERRFVAEPSYASRMSTAVGMLGSLILGAGVWARWIQDEPKTYAAYLVFAGAVLLVGSLWWSSRGPNPIRVGDLGIALEARNELQRIAWYEVQNISIAGDTLNLKTAKRELALAIAAHPKAVAKIVQEAAVRIPARLEISPAQHQALPKLNEQDGEVMTPGAVQVTGQPCQHCGQVITFERDARLCPACGAIYNSAHTPSECKGCGGSLGDRAVSV